MALVQYGIAPGDMQELIALQAKLLVAGDQHACGGLSYRCDEVPAHSEALHHDQVFGSQVGLPNPLIPVRIVVRLCRCVRHTVALAYRPKSDKTLNRSLQRITGSVGPGPPQRALHVRKVFKAALTCMTLQSTKA